MEVTTDKNAEAKANEYKPLFQFCNFVTNTWRDRNCCWVTASWAGDTSVRVDGEEGGNQSSPLKWATKWSMRRGYTLKQTLFLQKLAENCSESQREGENCFPSPPDLLAWCIRSSPLLGHAMSLDHTVQIRPATITLFLTCFGDCQTSSCGGMGLAWTDRAAYSQGLTQHLTPHLGSLRHIPSAYNPLLTTYTMVCLQTPIYSITSRYPFEQRKVYQELKTNKETAPSATSTTSLPHKAKVSWEESHRIMKLSSSLTKGKWPST